MVMPVKPNGTDTGWYQPLPCRTAGHPRDGLVNSRCWKAGWNRLIAVPDLEAIPIRPLVETYVAESTSPHSGGAVIGADTKAVGVGERLRSRSPDARVRTRADAIPET